MHTNTMSIADAMQISIAQYLRRHNGSYPARIFMTGLALFELTLANAAVSTNDQNVPHKAFGVPVCIFYGEGAEFYLSDEEA
ncbi:MAG: hypothetical protein ACOX7M_06340 [Dysosmobacter sp.]|jgi:hypothetical protein|uniref:hypothetical protein n=1 Tax=Dysosmobacter sp. TaxID=2591382 RepID=UPI003D8C45AE